MTAKARTFIGIYSRSLVVISITSLCLFALLSGGCATAPSRPQPHKHTLSSFDAPGAVAGDQLVRAGMMNFMQAELSQVLDLYQDLSGRTVVRSPQLPLNAKFTIRNGTDLTRVETLRLLDTALAQNGVVMVYSGEDTVKAIAAAAVSTEATPVIDLPADQLPDSKSFMIRAVTLKRVPPEQVIGIIQPFASLPMSIVAVKGARMIYLRDYASNVRQMLRVIDDVEKNWKPEDRPGVRATR